MAEDNFTSDKVSSLIATVIAIVIFIILFIKFVPVLYSFSMAGCEQEVMFRKNILGLSFGDVDFMQDMARWGWLSGFIPPLRQCSMPFNGYVINNSHYKSPDDACSGCGYEFKTKQEIIDIIIQSMINCWSTYSSGIDDSNGVLYYDKNPAPCSFIDLYLANETISIKNDILLEMKNGYTMAGKNKIYWNESLLVSDGFHRIFWKYTNALQQQSVSAGDSSTCYSNICSLSSISFDDSNFFESATGTCQSSCSASE